MFLGYGFVAAFCFCFGAGALFEFFGEGDVVEEGPGVIELVVPGSLKISHRLHHAIDFFIADQGKDGRVDSRGIGVIGGVIVGSPEFACGFVGFWVLVSGCSELAL